MKRNLMCFTAGITVGGAVNKMKQSTGQHYIKAAVTGLSTMRFPYYHSPQARMQATEHPAQETVINLMGDVMAHGMKMDVDALKLIKLEHRYVC